VIEYVFRRIYFCLCSPKCAIRVKRRNARATAKERIDILIVNALKEAKYDEKLADDLAQLAKKIAMRVRLRLTYEIHQLYCKKCKQLIIPGRTSRVRTGRTNQKSIRITCLRCGHTYRKIISE